VASRLLISAMSTEVILQAAQEVDEQINRMAGKFSSGRPRTCCALILIATLAGCTDEGLPLSVEEARKCATDEFEGHAGTFSQRGNAITFSYESINGPANVTVMFDGWRRPVSTFFESAPYGSHQKLMGAAEVIKNCVAYGRKAQRSNVSRSGTSSHSFR